MARKSFRAVSDARHRSTGPGRVLLGVVVTVVAFAVVSGCTAPAPTAVLPQPVIARPPGPPVLAVRELAGLGPVLTTKAGFVLYVFPPDEQRLVTCTGVCAGSWPPLTVNAGRAAVAAAGVSPALIGQVINPAQPTGPRVVTYAGWPLYTYAADVDPGQATGQGVDLNGGPWYAIAPSGRVVVPPGRTLSG